MSSRRLDDLHPHFRPMVDLWQRDMATASIDHIITCTWRSGTEQDALYAQGRSAPGPIVTNAQAGQSAHNVLQNGQPAACGLDFVIMVNGKPDWSGNSAAWNQAIALAEIRGLQSLRPMESAHLQDPTWRQLAGIE